MAFNKILVLLIGSVAGQLRPGTFQPLNFPLFQTQNNNNNNFVQLGGNNQFRPTAQASFPVNFAPQQQVLPSNSFNFAPLQTTTTTPRPSTSPVPILRFIDQQNGDGSYTFGYESADGTYKIETRLADGQVKGKYGYFDSDGNFREAEYGADSGRGFNTVVDGVEFSVPTAPPTVAPPTPAPTAATPTLLQEQEQLIPEIPEEEDIKIVNGRRAVLRKRVRPQENNINKFSSFPSKNEQPTEDSRRPNRPSRVNPIAVRERNLFRARQQQSRELPLEQPQVQVVEQQRSAPRSQLPIRPRVEAVRSNPRSFEVNTGFQEPAPAQPFLSGVDLSTGSYSISYSG